MQIPRIRTATRMNPEAGISGACTITAVSTASCARTVVPLPAVRETLRPSLLLLPSRSRDPRRLHRLSRWSNQNSPPRRQSPSRWNDARIGKHRSLPPSATRLTRRPRRPFTATARSPKNQRDKRLRALAARRGRKIRENEKYHAKAQRRKRFGKGGFIERRGVSPKRNEVESSRLCAFA